MTRQNRPPRSQEKAWSWSLQVENYDRRPEIDPGELAELDYWVDHTGKGYGVIPARSEKALHRLVQPLNDAIALIDFPTEYDGRRGLQLMLVEMHRRRTSFWAWSSADWLVIIGKNHADFCQRFEQGTGRQHLLAIAYVLLEFMDFWELRFEKCSLANKVFGRVLVESTIDEVLQALKAQGYESYGNESHKYRAVICEAFLSNRSPYLKDLTTESLDIARNRIVGKKHQQSFMALSVAFERLGVIDQPLQPRNSEQRHLGSGGAMDEVAPEWSEICERWFNTSTLAAETRTSYFYTLLAVGRWLAKNHPEISHPKQWTRSLAAEYIGAVDRMVVGQYSAPSKQKDIGKPLTPHSKSNYYAVMRTFFRNCQEWEWIPEHFHAQTAFETPRSVRALLQPQAKQIDDATWAKLLTAGLRLTEEDVESDKTVGDRAHWYPIEMVRALAVVWLFCALRKDDIRNLRTGCIRWLQPEEVRPMEVEEEEALTLNSEGKICLLDIPPGKNGRALTKAVDAIVGQAIQAWESVRPSQAPLQDKRTGEQVHYLFAYRSHRLGDPYLNRSLIPFLCEKAGVPKEDVCGKITSHRARHTILTQLSESMTIPQLQSWSGHQSVDSLKHYIKSTVTKQAAAYQKTDYFKRNQRMFDVLIDQEAITTGAAARGEPWKYHTLSDGYCVYEFFQHCPHRMACPQCSFYRPDSVVLQKLKQNKANLQKMLIEIELTTDEQAAVEEGIQAFENLCQHLSDVPTPAGLTPKQLGSASER